MVTANINLICSARLQPRLNIVKATLKGRTTCNNYHEILRGYHQTLIDYDNFTVPANQDYLFQYP